MSKEDYFWKLMMLDIDAIKLKDATPSEREESLTKISGQQIIDVLQKSIEDSKENPPIDCDDWVIKFRRVFPALDLWFALDQSEH